MPKDTKTLGNSKARACESLGFVHKKGCARVLTHLHLSPKVRAIPKAFTEKGLYMLATVLKSPRATATTLAIIESFAHLRELSRNLNILSTETDEGKQKTLTQRSSELLHELLSVEEMEDTTETESSIELNLYALKMKRTVKKIKKG